MTNIQSVIRAGQDLAHISCRMANFDHHKHIDDLMRLPDATSGIIKDAYSAWGKDYDKVILFQFLYI